MQETTWKTLHTYSKIQLLNPSDFQSDIFQYIFFCIPQRKENQVKFCYDLFLMDLMGFRFKRIFKPK